MSEQKRFPKYPWMIMMALSVLFLLWTVPLLLLSEGSDILEEALTLAGSTFEIGMLDEGALGFLGMSMLKPVWEEVWIGILALYCAIGLRQGKKHAWTLGLFWGVMMITNATIQGGYEVIILNWSNACMQTYLFLFLGIVAVLGMAIARKRFFAISL